MMITSSEIWRLVLAFMLGFVLMGTLKIEPAPARDLDGRFANSPLKKWFDGLESRKGPCCSDADGSALSDVDWEFVENHYRVRIDGEWWVVPDEAVVTVPNLSGRTMVWPVRYNNETDKSVRIMIRCFMPGSMS